MSTATIQIQYLDPPKEGKKQATIKTVDGQRFGVFADKVSSFGLEAGKTADIEYTSREYQGKTYHTITKVTAVSQSTNGAPKFLGDSGTEYTPKANGREARIERQAAHKVAIQFLALEFQANGTVPTLERLFELTDAIAADVGNTEPKPEQAAEPEVEL